MDVIVLIIGLIICTLAAAALLWATRATQQTVRLAFDPSQINIDIALDREIQEEIAAGRKINAIKLYRDLTNCGLREAKEAIEFLEANPDFDWSSLSDKNKHDDRAFPLDGGVRELIRAGRKQDALDIYQQFTGASLSDAEDEIGRLEWEESQRRARLG